MHRLPCLNAFNLACTDFTYCIHTYCARWGEPVLMFLACLLQHAFDLGLKSPLGFVDGAIWGSTDQWDPLIPVFEEPHKGFLGGRSPQYWICAYANNQWHLDDEISGELVETSFFRAMQLSKGTVSVIDGGGVSWTRIWWYVSPRTSPNMFLYVHRQCCDIHNVRVANSNASTVVGCG